MNATKSSTLEKMMHQTNIDRVWCKTMVSVITFGLILMGTNTPTSAQIGDFSLEKLMEYNDLVNCITAINKDFTQCNTRGAEQAKSVLGKMDMGAEMGKRIRCCGAWKLRDCWMKSANTKCTKAQAEQVYKLPSLFMPGLEAECIDYLPESGKCEFPIALAILVISVLAILVIICIGGIACLCRRKRKRDDAKSKYRHDGQGNLIYRDVVNKDLMIPGKRGVLVCKEDAKHHHHHHPPTLMNVDGSIKVANGHLANGDCERAAGGGGGKNDKNHKHQRHHHHHHHHPHDHECNGNGNGKMVKVNGNVINKQAQLQHAPPPLQPPDIRVEMPSLTEQEIEQQEREHMLPPTNNN